MKTPAIAACALFASMSVATTVSAEDTGAALYADDCAACHGATGKGDGDMASVTTIPAPNLTTLARRHDGVFPMLDVIHIIDGRTGVRAHGGAMPVFGRSFLSAEGATNPYGRVLEARGWIPSLALYLDSLLTLRQGGRGVA